MKKFKSHFKFNKQERSGIFFLLLIIVVLQLSYMLYHSIPIQREEGQIAVDRVLQLEMEALRKEALKSNTQKQYSFNPNFISDYKGYTLGMSVGEIDRLHHFRGKDNYVRKAAEFQKVTGVSDSLLKTMEPFFKFPSWQLKESQRKEGQLGYVQKKKAEISLKDLNTATAEDLRSIYGIGEKLSERIVKFRKRLGGFLVNDQLKDVYGLKPEVVARALERFQVLNPPIVHKININSASAEELSKLVYLQRKVAYDIVNYRNAQKTIKSFDELTKIKDFPINRIDRIKLYLSL
ncbi:ComEA family DNA-binding protein [Spongiimicrobium salis]|uniref:ComEA family DNA-binding protein n=1 Tax=Spongiimicrobium salis TaxID=1667022 RepID=UPI00374DC6E7